MSAIALRNWLDEGSERHVVFFIPEDSIASSSATGLDRQLAMRLFEYEKNGRIRFASLPADRIHSAPRLSLLVNGQVRAFYAGANAPPALAGALAGVSHQSSGPAADSWLSAVQGDARPLPGPLAALTEQLRAFRFRPGSPRKLSPLFQPVAGRSVELHVEDPWCGARSQNRARLAEFIRAVTTAGVKINGLTVVWNPDNQEGESASAQASAMGMEMARAGLTATPRFEPRSGRALHFHDRVITAHSVDDGPALKVRWDITAGIDNLMSVSKECSVFVEILNVR